MYFKLISKSTVGGAQVILPIILCIMLSYIYKICQISGD